MNKIPKNISGLVFGKLSVLNLTEKPSHIKSRGTYYLCRCECGNTKIVSRSSLVSGNTKSCGCLFIDSHKGSDISGERFGHVSVIRAVESPDNPKYSGTYYLCLCDCGNEFTTARKRIVEKSFKSCGCVKPIYKKIGCNSFTVNEEYAIYKDNKGRTFEVDIDDHYKIRDEGSYWYVSNRKSPSGNIECYVESNSKGKLIKLHNFIMNPDNGYVVDHVDGSPINNRKSNLRICLPSENAKNKKTQHNNTSGQKGVHLNKLSNKWVARISVDSKRVVLGTFGNFEDAVKARKEAEIKYFGEFANNR